MPTRMLRSATAEKHGAGDGHTTKNKTKQDLTVKITARERMRSRKKPRIHSPAPARNDVTMTLSELDEDDPLFDPSYDVDVLMKVKTSRGNKKHDWHRMMRMKITFTGVVDVIVQRRQARVKHRD